MKAAEKNARGLAFRAAVREDTPLILSFIRALAEYEQLLSEVTATEDILECWLFDKRAAEVIFALADGREVGFALFFQNFSTFLGRAGLYLEDLFVLPECRGRGIGKALFAELARLSALRGYGRIDWWCLNRNKPGIDFYRSLGAVSMDEWTVFRLTDDPLRRLENG
ncbi:MAG: GNAT family N-acetyltransferase [Oscillospiraceae bacterium]|nr:GNAT family N-acetyltransferase [Oscillospiraceae bacterium]